MSAPAREPKPGTPLAPPVAEGKISRGAWMALLAALLGWMFDGFEMGLFPLVGNHAMADLLGPERKADVGLWFNIMIAVFLVGAATGGVVFGWLGDRIGRVRAMTLSVFTYAAFMGLCGICQDVNQFMVARFIASLGMGGEWSLGVALVMEIWPNRSRGWLAGLIGAASNVGFLLVAVIGLGLSQFIGSTQEWLLSVGISQEWVDYLIVDANNEPTGWRLMMIIGAAPALLTFFIRLMVPESERWLHAREQGKTSAWTTRDMLAVVVGALGPIGMIYLCANDFSPTARIGGTVAGLALALAGFTFPVLRYVQRTRAAETTRTVDSRPLVRMMLGACLSGVALVGTWASLQNAPRWAGTLVESSMADATVEVRTAARAQAASQTQICSAIGAIVGTVAAALVGNAIGRRITYTLLCLGSLAAALAFFQLNHTFNNIFLFSVLLAGGTTASFYGWLPLYLPELFPTNIRATGQGFSFNFGRILAAVGALQMAVLLESVFSNDIAKACSTMSLVYIAGVVLIWFCPETHGKPLPE